MPVSHPAYRIHISLGCRRQAVVYCAKRSGKVIFSTRSACTTVQKCSAQTVLCSKGVQPPSHSLLSFSLPSVPFSLPSPGAPLPKPARESGERCKLPQWGLGQSPILQTIWCLSGPKGAAPVATVFVNSAHTKFSAAANHFYRASAY